MSTKTAFWLMMQPHQCFFPKGNPPDMEYAARNADCLLVVRKVGSG
jgi:hypothetical protein